MRTNETNVKTGRVPAVRPEPVTGTVVSPDAVVFAPATTAAARKAQFAENVATLRGLLAQSEKIGAGILARLVLAMVLNPSKGDTDALDSLTRGEGALSIPRAEVSKARAAYRLVSAHGISSTDDELWSAVLYTVGRAGVGAGRVEAALKGRGAKQKNAAAMRQIATAKGDEKVAAIRQAFKSTRESDGPAVGTKSFRQAEAAYKRLSAAVDVPEADGGMTKEERDQIATLLKRLTDRCAKPAKVTAK